MGHFTCYVVHISGWLSLQHRALFLHGTAPISPVISQKNKTHHFQGDPSAILTSQLNQPVVQIFYNSLGKSGSIAFTVFGFIIIKFVCFTAMVGYLLPEFTSSAERLTGDV
jgi:hypothetical protein